MAIQVSYGEPGDFNHLVYGNKDPRTLSYIENQLANVSQTLTEAGARFFANAQVLYDQFNSSEAMRLARAAVRKAGSIFQGDGVWSLWNLGDIQNAPPTMQRFIMAEPTVRQMYHDQRIDGYSQTYVDMHPGVIGNDHYDYRRVMNGMVTIDDEGLECTKFYLDELVEGDRELDITEKVDIKNTWAIVADLMQYGSRDATSVWDTKL